MADKRDWADDDEETAPNASPELPPTQEISNRDGTKTIISYSINEQGQKVKTTRRIRIVTQKTTINPRVADRLTWAKFGASAHDGPGPSKDTTTVGENILFRPSPHWRDAEKTADTSGEKDRLREKKITCRICFNEHLTAHCPLRDTLPMSSEATDVAAGMGDEAPATGGAGAKKGAYVPPALRGDRAGAAGGAGASSRFERDDLATLRVTNVSELAEENELRDIFSRFGPISRVFLARDKDTNLAKGFAFITYYERNDAQVARDALDGFGFRHLILHVEFAKKAA